MYTRKLNPSESNSFFLFGPRGTGKTTWVRNRYPEATYIDLLSSENYSRLLANPSRLEQYLTSEDSWVIIDEVQRVPELLNEVHRLIENRKAKFILTGSSCRKLRRGGYNLLAGRAFSYSMYPLLAEEMGDDFKLEKAVWLGTMPMAQGENGEEYLKNYIQVYLEQEILQEGLTRDLPTFARFLEVASLSQGQPLNMSEIARDVGVDGKTVVAYFQILKDLQIGYLLKPFSKRAKRRLVTHEKFYFFDSGVYRAIRPKGPLDIDREVGGAAVETLVLSQLMAKNDISRFGYDISYYRTATGVEVDFVLYGRNGLVAIEVKSGERFKEEMVRSLVKFTRDYPEARPYLLYGGRQKLDMGGVKVVPIDEFVKNLDKYLK